MNNIGQKETNTSFTNAPRNKNLRIKTDNDDDSVDNYSNLRHKEDFDNEFVLETSKSKQQVKFLNENINDYKITDSIKVNLQKELDSVIIKKDTDNLSNISHIALDSNKKAIPFINFKDDNDYFELYPEAEEFLKNLEGSLAIVSVAGMYRTGKSYLLNRIILNRKGDSSGNAFQVGPSVTACTKGLWIYPETIPVTNSKGEKLNLLVIDSEGLGDTGRDSYHDTKIFALALLFSSYFIYNSIGSIDEKALNSISFVSNLAKHIQVNNDMKPFLPSFLWVLRDFSLQLVDENKNTITTKEYLENALSYNSNTKLNSAYKSNLNSNKKMSMNSQKTNIREHLQNYFPERDCFALIRPSVDEKSLQNLNENNLRPDFIEQAEELRQKIYSDMKAKELKNNKLNGELFVSMVKSYIDSINNGEIPNIESAFVDVAKIEIKRSVNKAVNLFDSEIKELKNTSFPMEEIDLIKMLKTISKKAKNLILENKDYNSYSTIENCMNKLEIEIESRTDSLIKANREASKEAMTDYIEKNFDFNMGGNQNYFSMNTHTRMPSYISRTHTKNVSSLFFNFNDKKNFDLEKKENNTIDNDNNEDEFKYDDDNENKKDNNNEKFSVDNIKGFLEYLDKFYTSAMKKGPKGPYCNEVLTEFIMEMNKEYSLFINNKICENLEENTEKKNSEAKKLKEELNKINKQKNEDKHHLDFTNKKLEQELSSIKELSKVNENNLKEQLSSLKSQNSDLNEKVKSLINQMQSSSTKLEEDLNKEIDRLEEKVKEINEKLSYKEKEYLLLDQKYNQLTEENNSLTSKFKDLEGRNSDEFTSKKKNSALTTHLEAQYNDYMKKYNKIKQENIDLESKINSVQQEFKSEKLELENKLEDKQRILITIQAEIDDKNAEIEEISNEVKSLKIKHNEEIEKTKATIYEQNEKKTKELYLSIEEYKNTISNLTKSNSKLNQSIEFKNLDISSYKEKIEEFERTLNQKNKEISILENENTKMRELRDQEKEVFENNKKALNSELEAKENELKSELRSLEEKLTLNQNEVKKQAQIFNNKINSLNNQVKSLSDEKQCLSELLEKEKLDCSELIRKYKEEQETTNNEIEVKYQKIINNIREQLSENNSQTKKRLEEYNEEMEKEKKKYNSNLEELKNQHQAEIEELNQKNKDDSIIKDKEHQDYINELVKEYDQEISDYADQIDKLENEINFLNNTCETLRYNNDQLNSRLEDLKEMQNTTLTSLHNNFKEEKTELILRNNELNKANLLLETEKGILQSKVKDLTNALEIKDIEISKKTEENKESLSKLEEKIMKKKEEIKSLNLALNEIKLEKGTSTALHKQELKFKEKKIEELQEKLEKDEKDLEARRREIRNEIESEFKSTIDNLFKDKQEIEEALHTIKKENIKLESNFKSQKSALEQELAVLKEKYINAMKMKEDLMNAAEKERERMNSEIEKLKNNKKYVSSEVQKTIDDLKSQLTTKDEAIKELKIKLDHLSSNLENKVNYYSELNNNNKEFYQKEINTLQSIISQLKQEFTSEKAKLENSYYEKADKLDNKHKEQLKELKEEFSLRSEELYQKLKDLSSENKKLLEKIEINESERSNIKSNIEQNLRKELDAFYKELSNKDNNELKINIINIEKKYKESMNKIILYEQKLFEYENKENMHTFEMEKQKNDYCKEIENLHNSISKLKTKIVNLEKDKDETTRKNYDELKATLIKSKVKERSLIPKARGQSPRCFLNNSGNKENLNVNNFLTSKNNNYSNNLSSFKNLKSFSKQNTQDFSNESTFNKINYDSNQISNNASVNNDQ